MITIIYTGDVATIIGRSADGRMVNIQKEWPFNWRAK